MTRARSAAVGLVIAAPFYWLLIDSTYLPDLIAGGVAVLIAAAAFAAARFDSTESAAFRLRWLRIALAEISKVPLGVVIVCREIVAQAVTPRGRRGAIEADPLQTGDGDSLDLGRRALIEGLRSFAPNTVVIGVDPDSDRLLQHRIGGQR